MKVCFLSSKALINIPEMSWDTSVMFLGLIKGFGIFPARVDHFLKDNLACYQIEHVYYNKLIYQIKKTDFKLTN